MSPAVTRTTAIIIAIVVVIAVVGGVWAYYATRPKKPAVIKIGYIAPFTGPAAEFGTNGWRGVSIALDEINAEGIKIKGKTYTIEIIKYDDRCEPTEAAAAARKAILEDHVVAILGSHCSSCCLAIAPICDEYKIPGITIECMADAVTSPGHPYYFRIYPPSSLAIPSVADKVMKVVKPTKAAFLGINDDYGRSYVAAWKRQFEKYGVEVVYEEYYERGTTDFYSYLTAIKASGADSLFVVGVAAEQAIIVKQARELGLLPAIKYVGSTEAATYDMVELAGADAMEGVYAICEWLPTPKVMEFAEKVREKFNAPLHYANIYGYDCLRVLAAAIEEAQSLDPTAIRDALDEITYEGLLGTITFDEFDAEGKHWDNQAHLPYFLIVWHNGERTVPEEFGGTSMGQGISMYLPIDAESLDHLLYSPAISVVNIPHQKNLKS